MHITPPLYAVANIMINHLITVPTHKLLSSMVDAAARGSSTIRELCSEARNAANVTYKEDGDARSAMTLADTSAQKVIVSSLLNQYPDLNIVGEEDESVVVDGNSSNVELRQDLDLQFFHACTEGAAQLPIPDELELKDVVVYVDPLDGTREFVEGRFDNVQSLIGLCYRGRPLLGAIGLPFPPSGKVEVVYGHVGKGIGKVQRHNGQITLVELPPVKTFSEESNDVIKLSSGDSSNALLGAVISAAENVLGPNVERQIVGACGNKILRVAYGESTFSVMHDKTCLWDTAAPTAILNAVGGKVTDVFGEQLIYNDREKGNKLGVVVSAAGASKLHNKLSQKMRSQKEILSILRRFNNADYSIVQDTQCVDIVRDLDGYPLSSEFFAKKLDCLVESYTCNEDDAVRGLMSNGCRLNFNPSGKSAFFKRIVFANLDHARSKLKTAPHKLDRDVKSYRVESAWFKSKACQQIREAGLRIPRCYEAELRPDDDNPIESKFLTLLEDFHPSDGWSQRWLLRDKNECQATLSALARMHAYFWNGSLFWKDEDAGKELVEGVWESGSYVQPKLQTLNQCQEVSSGWMKNRDKCKKHLEGKSYWNNLGSRLQTIAEKNGNEAHPFGSNKPLSIAYDQFKTFTHGDPKQANLFFKKGVDLKLEVGLIDFQWSGFGLAATDIAHHITAAVHASLLVDGGEESLLNYYYMELESFLVQYEVFSDKESVRKAYSYETFVEQYETGVMDMCRLVIPYAWSRFEPVSDEMGYERTMNKNSYNKSVENVVWMMDKCDSILTNRGIS